MTDSITVEFCDEAVFIPNIITSNEDGFNDTFQLKGIDAAECSLTIINRNGTVVHHTETYTNDWLGSGLSSGIYYYRIHNRRTGKILKGPVHVVR